MKGIDIALFCLFGSLVWENLGSRLSGASEKDKVRKSIRAIAKYFFYSVVILIGAYVIDFGRDQPWVSVVLGTDFLTLLEELMVFVAYVMFAPPLYAVGKVLADPKRAIGDIDLPEVSQIFWSALLILIYLALIWWERIQPSTLISQSLELSFAIGIAGILLNFKKLQGWKKRAVPWLFLCPWIVLFGLVVLSGFGLIPK